MALSYNSHQLFLEAPTIKYFGRTNFLEISAKQGFLSQDDLGNFWKFGNRKPKSRINPLFTVSAASSSSSSFGGTASDYPEELISERIKKKRSSIAGIDQDELQDPRQLADSDSCFCEFKGVHIHYKVCEAESSMSKDKKTSQLDDPNRKFGFPMIFLHGFGASTFSWHRVMKPFAQLIGSKVLAFDRPAFGLTSRVSHSVCSQADDTKPLNPYSTAFSVLATLYFIDFLKSEKTVLVGHSAGSLTAVEAYFEAPDRVSALILVAPAIVAPLSATNSAKENQSDKENQVQESNSTSDKHPNLFVKFGQVMSKCSGYIINTIVQVLKGIMNVISSLYKKAIVALLRSALAVTLVRMIINKFGIAAVRNAWYDGNQVTDHILQGYTKPLRTKGWDKALVEYIVAMLMDTQAKQKSPLDKRLQNITCPDYGILRIFVHFQQAR
ncbi:uncharacterized protein [Spinacia oleracea]|uniref:Uncharacterized protein isoform X2 n=1 Tax=Spinacia oleracea TaxID=3562 RepID=A0ABM3R421_SPIOL|nr:uncharacterized protein LOC110778368 isoform X2 [Spinacia oleracea]